MATSPPAPRAYHHGNLRDALLRRAEEVLATSGADGLSLRAVARDVGVSHAAPRRHFPDRQSLLDALAEDGFARLGALLDGAAAGAAGTSFTVRFAAVAKAYVGFATGHAALLDLMFAGKHRPGASESLYAAAERAFATPFGLVADGQAAGEIVPGDPERLGVPMWATIHGLASMANGGLLDPEALPGLVEDAAERIVLGLRPR